jgi:hypothetical protein
MIEFHEATADELDRWDEGAVAGPGGHVYQSRAWAAHRNRFGSQPTFLVGSDGAPVLALRRPWPLIGGSAAYVPRGPIPSAETGVLVERLAGASRWLAGHRVDVIAADAEVETDSGYGDAIRTLGYHQIEEIQPARHRMAISLDRGGDEEGVFANVSKSTRQRIRTAEASGIQVARYDAARPDEVATDGFMGPTEAPETAFDRFYDVLVATGERLDFHLGPRSYYVDWWRTALDAGHLVFLEGHAPDGEPIAGLILYRHGDRLSTVHSGDVATARQAHPGVMHLLRWRAIQLAIREGRAEMDLGGVDVPGMRHEPGPGEPRHGLYEHKRSFGAHWVELVGAHERVVSRARYAIGRTLAAAARRLDSRP